MAKLTQDEINAIAEKALVIAQLNITQWLTTIKEKAKSLKDTINGN